MPTAKCSRIWTGFFCLLLTVLLLPAQAATRFLARSWQSEDGLPSNVVRAVAQASDGYLWVGTAEGVVRFDGRRFTGFPAEPDKTLARRPVRFLYALANGEVWISTVAGGLLRGRGARLEEIELPASADGATVVISSIFLGDGGEVLVARGEDLWRVSGDNVARPAELTPEREKLLQKDSATQSEQGRPTQGEQGVQFRGAKGQLWRYTSGVGLSVTDASRREEMVPLQSEPASVVQGMLEDREGNLWLATRTQGLWRLRPARVELYTQAHGLSDRTSLLVFEDHTGKLWVAPQSGGLDYVESGVAQHLEIVPGPMQRTISSLMETRAGVLWLAMSEAQVFHRKGKEFKPAFPRETGPGKVAAMIEDERGQIWFGGRHGLAVWNGVDERRAIDLGAPEAISALCHAASSIWAGTESGKVFQGKGDHFVSVGGPDAFARTPISSLFADSDGNLWVGTMGGGLFVVRNGRVTSLAEHMADVDSRITCVLDDDGGFLWLGTLGGICRVEKAKLLGLSSKAASATLVLDRSDGLLTRECTRGGQPAGWRGRDGTLYFTTGHGVARVNPKQLALNEVAPRIVVEEAKAGAQALALDQGPIQVGPGRSRLEFRYTALTFTAPERVRFRTRLEGLDEEWRDTGIQRVAAYEAVPPGRYRFRVIADNGDGLWNETGATLAIEVLPHFWETRWFQICAIIFGAALAVGMGAMVMRARLRGRLLRLEAQTSRQKERARIAQDLHDDLGASLTEISLLANLAAEERAPGDREDDTLPEVASKAQALVGVLDEIVWAVNPRHDTLRSLAEYIAAFGGKFLERAGMTLRRDVPRDLPEVSLDAECRHHIFLTVREALNNVVKHSGATEVWLRFRLEADELRIAVEDNGRGLGTAVDDLSEGLRGMRSRMEKIGGICRIESSSEGTRVRLSLPVDSERR